MNHLTIHFHLKHYKDSGLPLTEYFVLLMYEQKEIWPAAEISDMLSITIRTVSRIRTTLTSRGFLEKVEGTNNFKLTDKLYK